MYAIICIKSHVDMFSSDTELMYNSELPDTELNLHHRAPRFKPCEKQVTS